MLRRGPIKIVAAGYRKRDQPGDKQARGPRLISIGRLRVLGHSMRLDGAASDTRGLTGIL